jgi:hypothetical protein
MNAWFFTNEPPKLTDSGGSVYFNDAWMTQHAMFARISDDGVMGTQLLRSAIQLTQMLLHRPISFLLLQVSRSAASQFLNASISPCMFAVLIGNRELFEHSRAYAISDVESERDDIEPSIDEGSYIRSTGEIREAPDGDVLIMIVSGKRLLSSLDYSDFILPPKYTVSTFRTATKDLAHNPEDSGRTGLRMWQVSTSNPLVVGFRYAFMEENRFIRDPSSTDDGYAYQLEWDDFDTMGWRFQTDHDIPLTANNQFDFDNEAKGKLWGSVEEVGELVRIVGADGSEVTSDSTRTDSREQYTHWDHGAVAIFLSGKTGRLVGIRNTGPAYDSSLRFHSWDNSEAPDPQERRPDEAVIGFRRVLYSSFKSPLSMPRNRPDILNDCSLGARVAGLL